MNLIFIVGCKCEHSKFEDLLNLKLSIKINFFFLIFLVILSIKYSEEKHITTDETNYLNKSIKIKTSDLNYCPDCCDDLGDYELKEMIENKLDFNYFSHQEALKKEMDIYKDMKIACLHEKSFLSCVDLCLCHNNACIYQQINRIKVLKRGKL